MNSDSLKTDIAEIIRRLHNRSSLVQKSIITALVISVPVLLIPFREPVQIQGITQAFDTDTVTSQFSGTIEKIYYYPDSRIKKGDPLYSIASWQYQEEAVQSNARLSNLRTQLICAKKNLDKNVYKFNSNFTTLYLKLVESLPDLDAARRQEYCTDYSGSRLTMASQVIQEKERELEKLVRLKSDFKKEYDVLLLQVSRYAEAVRKGAISPLQYEQAYRELMKSKKELNQVTESIRVSSVQLQQAKTNLVEVQTKLMLEFEDLVTDVKKNYSIDLVRVNKFPKFRLEELVGPAATANAGNYLITAAFPGVVYGQQNFKIGDFVKEGQSLANITDPATPMFVVAQAAAIERKKIQINAPAKISYVSPRTGAVLTQRGAVSAVSAISNVGSGVLTRPNQTQDSAENRSITYPVVVRFADISSQDSISKQLIPGESVKVIVSGPKTNLLLLLVRPLREKLMGVDA